jgi:phosphatidate cytidylyltransferase
MEQKNNNLENKYADVPLRVRTWIYIILVFAVAIAHPIAMKIFISWIGFQVFFEFLRMFQIKTNIIIASLSVGITQFFLLYGFFNDYDGVCVNQKYFFKANFWNYDSP